MTDSEHRFAVFFGTPDQKRGSGWYWTGVDEPGDVFKHPITGPFETKEEAVEHAIRNGAGRLH
jgi:hypothetical protein